MRDKSTRRVILAALLLPGTILFVVTRILNVEAWWLFIYYGIAFTLAALLLTATFWAWTATTRAKRAGSGLRSSRLRR